MTDTPEEKRLDDLVADYLKLRTEIKERKDAHAAEIAALEEPFDRISAQILERCNAQNADTIRTPAGTISRRVSTRYWTTDWDTMYRFINENAAPHLLEQRIHNGNMRQFIDENPDVYPAGLQADNRYAIQVRRPTTKA
jgi:hypothetical protein